jgi:lipoprotein-anchoring transpeptidase ErfK/SrfK
MPRYHVNRMRMNQTRYAVVFFLIVASTFILSFRQGGAPSSGQPPAVAAATPVTSGSAPSPSEATEAPSVTLTPLAAPTVSPEPPGSAPTATLTATLAVSTTATVGATGTATAGVTPSTPVTSTALTFDPRPDLPRYVYIDQAVQHMYVLEQGAVVKDMPCSTGLPFSNTYTPAWTGVIGEYWGTFFAFSVYADEAWYLFKSDGSILIHSLPYTITVAEGPKEYQDADLLGVRPASHGCIRISPEDAAWFTAWDPEGVPITVTDPYRAKWQ